MSEIVLFVLFDLLLIFFPVGFIIKKKKLLIENFSDLKPIWQELGLFSKGFKTDLKRTLGLFLILFAASVATSIVLFHLGLHDLEKVSEVIVQISLPVLAYLLVVRVFAEEIFFRGFLVKRVGVFGSAVIFALVHATYFSVAEIIGTFVLGVLLALAFKKNSNLIPNIFAHMLYNISALIFLM